MQLTCQATSPQESEVAVLAPGVKKILQFATLSNQLGFKQDYPLKGYGDNAPAIGLTKCPEIPRKSKYINNLLQFVRNKNILDKELTLIHIDNVHNYINLLTKPLQGKQFIYERNNLMNIPNL